MPKDLSYAVSEELKAKESQPVLLFQLGLSSTTLYYTAEKNNVTFNGNTYTAKTIGFGSYAQSTEGQINRVQINLDNTARDISTFAVQENFDGRPLVILRVYRNAMSGTTDFVEVFRGSMEEIAGVKRPWFPISASAGKPLYQRALLEEYQRTCRHIFGDANCNALAPAPVYTSNFGAGADSWTGVNGTAAGNIDNIGGIHDTLRFTIDAADDIHNLVRASLFTIGKNYKLSYKYYIPSTNTKLDGIRAYDGTQWLHTTEVVTDVWTTIATTAVFTAGGTGLEIFAYDGAAFTFQDAGGNDVFYIKDVFIEIVSNNADLTDTDFYSTGAIVSGTSKSMIIDPSVGTVTGTNDDAFNYGIIKVGFSGTTYIRTCHDWDSGTSKADWQVQLPVDVDSDYRYIIYKGCPKTIGACTMAYAYGPSSDNQANYGGFMHIATDQEMISAEIPAPTVVHIPWYEEPWDWTDQGDSPGEDDDAIGGGMGGGGLGGGPDDDDVGMA